MLECCPLCISYAPDDAAANAELGRDFCPVVPCYPRIPNHPGKKAKITSQTLRGCPSASDVYPFRKTTPLFSFHIHNIRITLTSAPNAVLLGRIPRLPVIIFFFPFLLVFGRFLEERWPGQLTRRGIGRTMLDCGMSVAKVPEVMYILGTQECPSRQGVDGRISPLQIVSYKILLALLVAYPFHPEPSTSIHHLKEFFVLPTPKPIKPSNLEITPEMTHIVNLALHRFRVDIWHSSVAGLGTKDFFG